MAKMIIFGYAGAILNARDVKQCLDPKHDRRNAGLAGLASGLDEARVTGVALCSGHN